MPVEAVRRRAKAVLLVLGLLAVAFAALAAIVIGPRNILGLVRYGSQRQEGTLKVGDSAPDIALVALDGSTRVRVRDSVGPRPLVLVFGSYT